MSRIFQSPVLLIAAGLFCAQVGAAEMKSDSVSGEALRAQGKAPAGVSVAGVMSAQFEWKEETTTTLVLRDKGVPVLAYNFGLMTREGVAQKKWRSGYIHPIYSVDGTRVLTDDFPADHLHHRGLFWAWPKITIEGVLYDLWQYDAAPIEQRFERWVERKETEAAAILELENGWYTGERKVMKEEVKLYVRPRNAEGRTMTLELRLTPTDRPVTLEGAAGKGYGGLSLRMAVKKEADCTITTARGSERKDLLEAPINWAGISNKFEGLERVQGITISEAPGHTPPAARWMTRHYGCLCAGWPGTSARTIQVGETVVLKYQVLVHEGNAGDIQ